MCILKKRINWLCRWMFKVGMVLFLIVCSFYLAAILFGVVLYLHLPNKTYIASQLGRCGIIVLLCMFAGTACEMLSDYFKKRL